MGRQNGEQLKWIAMIIMKLDESTVQCCLFCQEISSVSLA
jgi:hypothetical protein